MLIASACCEVFCWTALTCSRTEDRRASILSSWEVCGGLRVCVCAGLPQESKSWTVEATDGELMAHGWSGEELGGWT